MEHFDTLEDYQTQSELIRYDQRMGEYNSQLPQKTSHLRMKQDTEFILPEVMTTYAEEPTGSAFNGHFSQATAGSIIPGIPDPNLVSVGIVAASDLRKDYLSRFHQETEMPAPHNAMLGDKGQDPQIIEAMRSLLGTGQQTQQMIDARELDAFRRGWRGVGQISAAF